MTNAVGMAGPDSDQADETWELSALRSLVLGFGAVVAFFVGTGVWSLTAPITGAVITTGQVKVKGQNQIVEHLDGGAVKEITVVEGDAVQRDEILLRFDDTVLRAEEAILVQQYVEVAARRTRHASEAEGRETIEWSPELSKMAQDDAVIFGVLGAQERLFATRRDRQAKEIDQIRQQIAQAQEEIRGLEARATAIRGQQGLVDEELAATRKLYEAGLTRLTQLLALQRARQSFAGMLGETRAGIAGVRRAISEREVQILQIEARRLEEAETMGADLRARENEIAERLSTVRNRLGRMDVRAPVTGRIFKMNVVAEREVVRPGEPILYIVPEGSRLVAVARLNPNNVDQVFPGQKALLLFTAFPLRESPEFEGKVVRVSADAIVDEATGASWYEVELEFDEPVLELSVDQGRTGASRLPISPGMPVEVHIQTVERSPLSYFTKPATDYFTRALRED